MLWGDIEDEEKRSLDSFRLQQNSPTAHRLVPMKPVLEPNIRKEWREILNAR